MLAPRTIVMTGILAAAALSGAPSAAAAAEVVVDAGGVARQDTPVVAEVRASSLGNWPAAVMLREVRDGRPVGAPIPAEVGHVTTAEPGGDVVRLTFVLAGTTPAHARRRFRVEPEAAGARPSPWSLSDPSTGGVDLKNRGRAVFRYKTAPVSNSDYPKVPARDAYIHPAFTPSGALITGDFSTHHPHHRGFFLAYTKTRTGDLHPDFWNIQNRTGLIAFDGLEAATAGPVTARIVARHRWEAKGGGTVLRETWEVRAYDIPGAPYWMFDLTSTQRAVDNPLELPPYRYGGMAYRGPEPFLKGTLDVLTSEGLDRKRGDQKPARWVDLTGPVAEGADRYGGAMILDHPSNPHHPTPARIHPTSLPFFAFTPSHDGALAIPTDRPTVFRYRVVIHDGRPDRALDERLWQDFAGPPVVTVGAP